MGDKKSRLQWSLLSLLPRNHWEPASTTESALGMPVGKACFGSRGSVQVRVPNIDFSALAELTAADVCEELQDSGALQHLEFEAHVSRFMKSERSHEECLSNFALGIAGEAGEVVELIKKHLHHGNPLNREDLTEEIGGLLWYVQALATQAGITLTDAMAYNQAQLEARHGGQSFKAERSEFGKQAQVAQATAGSSDLVGTSCQQAIGR